MHVDDIESVKVAKYIHVGSDKILINNVRLGEVAKAYFQARREEITKDKVNDFIENFYIWKKTD